MIRSNPACHEGLPNRFGLHILEETRCDKSSRHIDDLKCWLAVEPEDIDLNCVVELYVFATDIELEAVGGLLVELALVTIFLQSL